MSIENNIKTIADSLESISDSLELLVKKFDHIGQACDSIKQPAAPTPEPPPAPAAPAAAPTPPPAPAAEAPAAPAPEANVAAPTADEVNQILMDESKRIGGTDAIFEQIRSFGVTGVSAMTPEQLVELVAKVKAL